MSLTTHHRVTLSLAWATFIACLSTFQFGFHLAELNAPEALLSCNFHRQGPLPSYEDTLWSQYGLKQCLSMGGSGIASITTMFAVGGFVSSVIIGSTKIVSTFGRRQVSMTNSLLFCSGSLLMSFANSFWMLCMGRFVVGLAGGSSMVVSPILINELTPINHRGVLGAVLQLAVSVGILVAQVVGYFWSNDQQWRNIFTFSAGIGLFQFCVLFTTIESPKWLIINRGDIHNAKKILKDLRTDHGAAQHEINHWRRLSVKIPGSSLKNETSALLDEPVNSTSSSASSITSPDFIPLTRQVSRRGSIDPSHITIGEYLFSKKFSKERFAIFGVMSGQQLCGINAITFYGVRVLKDIVPKGTSVLALTCSLSICNVFFALLASPFTDKFGRKSLLISSVGLMAISSAIISFGLTHSMDYLTAGGCFLFNIGYSFGLAPLPFLMVPELASHDSLSAAQSVGSALNWASNVTVAFCFPILQELVGGYIFYGFFIIQVCYILIFLKYLPETRGYASSEEVWRNFKK